MAQAKKKAKKQETEPDEIGEILTAEPSINCNCNNIAKKIEIQEEDKGYLTRIKLGNNPPAKLPKKSKSSIKECYEKYNADPGYDDLADIYLKLMEDGNATDADKLLEGKFTDIFEKEYSEQYKINLIKDIPVTINYTKRRDMHERERYLDYFI